METYEHFVDRDIVDIIAKKIVPPKRKIEKKRKWAVAGMDGK